MWINVSVRTIGEVRTGINAARATQWMAQDVLIAWPEFDRNGQPQRTSRGEIIENFASVTLWGDNIDKLKTAGVTAPGAFCAMDIRVDTEARKRTDGTPYIVNSISVYDIAEVLK